MNSNDVCAKIQAMKKLSIAIIVIISAVLIGALAWLNFFNASKQTACTLEAKICPDGSSVGRTGLDCEFARCPEITDNNPGWKTFNNDKQAVTFQYPDQLAADYIHSVDWPPQIAVNNGPFSCVEGGSEIAQVGKTQKIAIGDHEYCLAKESEGAAGSVYTQYAYSFPENGKVLTFIFALRFVQCANYDDPQKTQCEEERRTFNIDSIIDRMAQSVEWK